MSTVELLAPVGHREGLIAAVANGADAIYVGGQAFGARKEAAFSNDDLIDVIKYAHIHNVKVYVTVNTTIFDEELEALKSYIHFLYTHDVDAIIVQDIGVAKLVKQLYPDFELHFSTQMTLHNTKGAEFAKSIGADRIVVARENTLEEIQAIKQNVDVEIEAFVHGAICVCYSGQCLMSSMIGARSGNRGACAQTCRLPYELIDVKTGETIPSNIGNYLLSPRDLNTIDEVGALIEAGVHSFKIEGRLKRPEYVATVVAAYRKAIDQYLATNQVKVSKQTHADMEQIFNRGFTKGYLFGETGLDLMSADRPNHKGVLIGEVVGVDRKRLTVQLNAPLHVGDGLRFVSKSVDKDQGQQVQKMFVKNKEVKAANKGLVSFDAPFTAVKGMKVYKTASVELNERVIVSDKEVDKLPIYGEVSARLGEPLAMMLWDDFGHVVSASSQAVFEPAQKTPLTTERLTQQLQKTGNTPFKFELLNVQVDEGITISISEVNAVRRLALEELQQKVEVHNPNRSVDVETVLPTISKYERTSDDVELTVSVRNLSQLQVLLNQDAVHTIYYKDMATLKKAYELATSYGKTLVPQTARIMTDAEISFAIQCISELGIETVMVGEYGMLYALRVACPQVKLLADFSFNSNNVQSVESLKQLGVSQATLSYEVNSKQIRKLLSAAPLPMEAVVYTRIPMMITKHCPVKTLHDPKNKTCRVCFTRSFGLKDRKNKIMPLLRTGNCLTEILNAQHVIWLEFVSDLKKQGVSSFRLEFTNESETQMSDAITAYTKAIRFGRIDKNFIEVHKADDDYTKGHYHRGVE
ncbi:MAG TPA: U32 family peptidase [Firmicutes bacterium]|nr:U32 family peptidase [Bacillota bacterium]